MCGPADLFGIIRCYFFWGGRSEAGALCGAIMAFSAWVALFVCRSSRVYAATPSLCTFTCIHGPGQLSWVCTWWWGMVAAQCPVMDEGGGGDFPRGRLAPGSYDLSRALLSFCWAPLQSHSLQRLLSQAWGQGLSNVCVCVCGRLDPSPRETLMPETRALWSCEEEDQVVIHLLRHNPAPRGNTM